MAEKEKKDKKKSTTVAPKQTQKKDTRTKDGWEDLGGGIRIRRN